MKLKLILIAALLLVIVLAIHFSQTTQSDVTASEFGQPTSTVVDSPQTVMAADAARETVIEGEPEPVSGADAAGENRTAVASVDAPTPTPAKEDLISIEVFVQDQKGRPQHDVSVGVHIARSDHSVAGAQPVQFIKFLPDGTPEVSFLGSERTRLDGLARFQIKGAAGVTKELVVVATEEKLTASRSLSLPLESQRVTLTLLQCASVEVSLIDADGKSIPGAYVDVKWDVPWGEGRRSSFLKSDERGLALFDALRAGEHEFSYVDKATGTTLRRKIDVELEGRYRIELRCAPPTLLSCVSGTVVDEAGKALPRIQVRVRVDGGNPVAVTSNEHGAFGCYSDAIGREVEVGVGGGMWDDDFDPNVQRVPFGTTDVQVRRTRVVPVIRVEFIGLDAMTGAPIGLSGKRYRAGRPEESAMLNLSGKDGKYSLLFRDHADWHVVVNSPGYLPQELAFANALQRDRDTCKLVVRLLPDPNAPKPRENQALSDLIKNQ